MRLSLRPLFALTLLALAAGCSNSSSVPLSGVDQAYANAVCTLLVNCPQPGNNAALQRLLASQPSLTTCQDAVLQSGDLGTSELQASVAAGRIKYDGAAAKKCLDALASSCTGLNSSRATAVSPACDQVWLGQVAVGGSCMLDEDCAGDAYCDGGGAGNACGTCKALVPIGQPCGGSNDCTQNVPGGYAVCQKTTLNPNDHCVAVTLTGNVGGGGSCGLVNQTAESWQYASCASGFYCRGGGGGSTGVCAAPIALGQACTRNDVCANNALCLPNAGGTPGDSCQTVTIQNTAGQPCTDTQPCNPLNRLECDPGSHTCVSVGTGVVGQPCRDNFPADCNLGLYCDLNLGGLFDGACATKLADGAACDPGTPEACLSSFCDDVTNPVAPVCGVPVCK